MNITYTCSSLSSSATGLEVNAFTARESSFKLVSTTKCTGNLHSCPKYSWINTETLGISIPWERKRERKRERERERKRERGKYTWDIYIYRVINWYIYSEIIIKK